MKYFLKLSSLCKEIALNIFLVGSIIRMQFSADNYLGVHISSQYYSAGNSLSASCLRANYLGDNFRLAIFGGQLSRGAIVRGAIILGGNCPGVNYPGDNCPGGNYPGGNCPVPALS